MPATRIRRSHVAARNNATAIQLNPAIFGSLTAAQLQELCRQNGLPATGRRPALQKRLQDAGIAQNVEPQQQNPSEVTDGQSSSNNGDQRPVIPDQFTAEQMSQIKRLIQDSVATATREIASEAARAAVSAMQAQAPALPTPAANLPDIFPPQQQPPVAEQTQQTANPASCHNGAPFQDIPGNYVKEIQSDIDECLEMTFSCDPASNCENTPGGYDCKCKEGYYKTKQGTCAEKCSVSCGKNSFCYHGMCLCLPGYSLGPFNECYEESFFLLGSGMSLKSPVMLLAAGLLGCLALA